MSIEQWWPAVAASTREWLIANNGDVLTPEVRAEIVRVGGTVDGVHLSDEESDWIEAVANDEPS